MAAANKNQSYRKYQMGFSILETAIVLPVLLGFALAAIDVSTYLRTYNGARQAVSAGLRCLYPSDAQCLKILPATTIPQNEYYIPPFFASHMDYNGKETRLLLPDYSYGVIQATVLNRVYYIPDTQAYDLDRHQFAAEGTAKILTLEVPKLKRNTGSSSDLIVSRTALIEGGLAANASVLQQSSAIRCDQLSSHSNSNYGTYHGSFAFDVPDYPVKDRDLSSILNCQYVQNGEKSNRHSDSCLQRAKANMARVFLKVNGTAESYLNGSPRRSSSRLLSGHVNIQVTYNGKTTKYGGHDFSTDGIDDFDPRGFQLSEAGTVATDNFGLPHNAAVRASNHPLIEIPWGAKNVLIEIYLSQSSSPDCPLSHSLRWRLDNLQVAFAKPSVVAASDAVACRQPQYASQCDSSDPSQKRCEHVGVVSFPKSGNFVNPQVFNTTCGSSVGVDLTLRGGCFDLPPNTSEIAQYIPSHYKPEDFIARSNGQQTCVATERSEICPANYGALSPAEAKTVCPAKNPKPNSESWTEVNIPVTPAGTIKIKTQDCSFNPENPMPLSLVPANIRQYAKLILPTAQQNGSSQIDTSYTDPLELKKQPLYSCPAVEITQRDFSENSKNSFSDEEWQRLLASSFNGPAVQLGCQEDSILRAQALSIGMSPLSYFEVSTAVPIPDTNYQIQEAQIDSCMSVYSDISLAGTNLRKKIPGGPFDEGVIPSACIIQQSNKCISIPAGVRQIESDGKIEIDYTFAKDVALKTAQAFVPSACEECVMITPPSADDLALSGNLKDQPLKFKVDIKQPLFLLGKKPVTISYESSRRWEGAYSY